MDIVAGLVAAVVASPRDATPRLVLADFLHDRGFTARERIQRRFAADPPSEWAEDDRLDDLGEYLRDAVFAQNRRGSSLTLGCYSTFEVRAGVEMLPPVVIKADPADEYGPMDDVRWTRCRLDDIECGWHWDGDGTLVFGVGGVWIENPDCKKTRYWRVIDGPLWEATGPPDGGAYTREL